MKTYIVRSKFTQRKNKFWHMDKVPSFIDRIVINPLGQLKIFFKSKKHEGYVLNVNGYKVNVPPKGKRVIVTPPQKKIATIRDFDRFKKAGKRAKEPKREGINIKTASQGRVPAPNKLHPYSQLTDWARAVIDRIGAKHRAVIKREEHKLKLLRVIMETDVDQLSDFDLGLIKKSEGFCDYENKKHRESMKRKIVRFRIYKAHEIISAHKRAWKVNVDLYRTDKYHRRHQLARLNEEKLRKINNAQAFVDGCQMMVDQELKHQKRIQENHKKWGIPPCGEKEARRLQKYKDELAKAVANLKEVKKRLKIED